MPDAKLPYAMIEPLQPQHEKAITCGPVLTAEFSFSASGMVNAAYQTIERDWIEQIVTDVGRYIKAFKTNRENLVANTAGSGITPGTQVKF